MMSRVWSQEVEPALPIPRPVAAAEAQGASAQDPTAPAASAAQPLPALAPAAEGLPQPDLGASGSTITPASVQVHPLGEAY